MALLFAAWIHACIGLRFWLRLQPWYDALQPLLFAAAILLPVFALLGYVAGGREIGVVMAQNPSYVAHLLATQPPPEARPALFVVTWGIRFIFLGAIVTLLIARMVRHEWWRRKGVLPRRAFDRRGARLYRPRGKPLARRAARRDLRWPGTSWTELLINGEHTSIESLAVSINMHPKGVRKSIRLAFLAPEITEAIVLGRHPKSLTLTVLQQTAALSWVEQRRRLGIGERKAG